MFDVTLALESCMICGVWSSCFKCGSRFVQHAPVRHGNVTSVRDVFLVSLFHTLLWFVMFSRSCSEHEELTHVLLVSFCGAT